MIVYTPERIFSNNIPLFNINFFNGSEENSKSLYSTQKIQIGNDEDINYIYNNTVDIVVPKDLKNEKKITKEQEKEIDDNIQMNLIMNTSWQHPHIFMIDNKWYCIYASGTGIFVFSHYDKDNGEEGDTILTLGYEDVDIENGTVTGGISAEKAAKKFREYAKNHLVQSSTDDEYTKKCQEYRTILEEVANRIKSKALLSSGANASYEEFVFEGMNLRLEYKKDIDTYSLKALKVTPNNTIKYQSSSSILQNIVSSMYKTLRTLAIVALLVILVYLGIRMVLSSASKDKAKYKQMLMDWLIAFIMVFVLHYIMAFIIDISEKLTMICSKSNIENIELEIPANTSLYDTDINDWVPIEGFENRDGNENPKRAKWYTNFVGYIRFYAGLVQQKGYTLRGVSYTIMYIVLVIYTVMFSFQYMKRVLYMAFLTMIAPLVAITYPLDKINDGSAQGFNMWLREYIFNALIQPIHCIIYVIIMGSVMEMVVNHPIYALVALGFMVPAEKFIRKMFGFEKAGTVAAFGGAAGAAMLMSGVQKLTHKPHKKDDNDEEKGETDNSAGKIKTTSAIPSAPKGNDVGKVAGGAVNGVGTGMKAVGKMAQLGKGIPVVGTGLAAGGKAIEGAGKAVQKTGKAISGKNNKTGIRTRNLYSRPRGTARKFGAKANGLRRINKRNIRATARKKSNTTKKPTVIRAVRKPKSKIPSTASNVKKQAKILETKKPNKFKRVLGKGWNGVTAATGHYTRRLDNRLRKSHPLRAIRRGVTYGIGAATLGTIGLAAGIASGDPSKALQYTVAGGIAGGNLGKNLGETDSNIIDVDGTTKAFKKGYLGEEYDKKERDKHKREFKKDVANYNTALSKGISNKQWREMSKEDGIIDKALDHDITNINDIIKLQKGKEAFRDLGFNDEEAEGLAFQGYELDKKFGDYSSNSKTQENMHKLLINKGWRGEDLEKQERGMVQTLKTYQNATGAYGRKTIEDPNPVNYERMIDRKVKDTKNKNNTTTAQSKTRSVAKRKRDKSREEVGEKPQKAPRMANKSPISSDSNNPIVNKKD